MKMVIAIVQDNHSSKLSTALVDAGIKATKLSSTGSFLKSGNTTFLIGTEENKVAEIIAIIKQVCSKKDGYMLPPINVDSPTGIDNKIPVEVQVGGATVFVVPVEGFYHF